MSTIALAALNLDALARLKRHAGTVLADFDPDDPNSSMAVAELAELVTRLLPQMRAAVMMAGPALADATGKEGRCGAWTAPKTECGSVGPLFLNPYGGECCRACYERDKATFDKLGSGR